MSYNNKPDEFSLGISTYGTSLTVGLNSQSRWTYFLWSEHLHLSPVHTRNDNYKHNYKDNDISIHTSERYIVCLF